MSSENFESKKVGFKKLLVKEIWSTKKIVSKKVKVKKILGPEKMLVPKRFESKNNFGSEKF